MITDKELINRIAAVQHSLRMESNEMAERMGVSGAYYRMVVHTHRRHLTIEMLMGLSKSFPNLSMEYLIRGAGDMWLMPVFSPDDTAETLREKAEKILKTTSNRTPPPV